MFSDFTLIKHYVLILATQKNHSVCLIPCSRAWCKIRATAAVTQFFVWSCPEGESPPSHLRLPLRVEELHLLARWVTNLIRERNLLLEMLLSFFLSKKSQWHHKESCRYHQWCLLPKFALQMWDGRTSSGGNRWRFYRSELWISPFPGNFDPDCFNKSCERSCIIINTGLQIRSRWRCRDNNAMK